MAQTKLFQRVIALPQDHGSWVFVLSPLLIGGFAGKSLGLASLVLALTVMAAFLLRQPVMVAVKVWSGRRPRTDLPVALFWMGVYGVIAALGCLGLLWLGHGRVLWLAVPAAPVFAWHLYLVSRRAERRQGTVEIVATGVLALAAPAALWVGLERYDVRGWVLWILCWFQSAASIVHAYLRLEQREWKQFPPLRDQWVAAWRAVAYTGFNFCATLGLFAIAVLPGPVFLPYGVQFAETLWGIRYPAIGLKPVAIGVRQLLVSILFTVLFILTWR